MSLIEKKETIKFVVDTVHKRIPVIAGTGSNCTQSAIELSKYAEDVGVDGLLIVSPYYNKTTNEGLVKHYLEIAHSTNLPIILYNVPSRTGVNISPDISQIAEIASICKDKLNIYSGNDDQIVPILSLGGIGVISVVSNILPYTMHDMVIEYLNGNINTAKELQLKILPLNKLLFSEVNPIPIKSALNMIGFNVGKPRLPLIEMSSSGQKALNNLLIKEDII